MSRFLLAYHPPKNYRPTPDTMAAWNAWFDSMGANVVERGNPIFESRAIGTCGTESPLGGYSLITADDLEEAVTLARGCPFVPLGGGVEVGQLAEPRVIVERSA